MSTEKSDMAIDEADKELLAQLAESRRPDRVALDAGVSPPALPDEESEHHVEPEECYRMRVLDAAGWAHQPIANFFARSPGTVDYHTSGGCGCDVGWPSDPHDTRQYRQPVKPTECATMHHLYRAGWDALSVAGHYKCSESTVREHVHDLCGHDIDLDETRVSAPLCEAWRLSALEGREITIAGDWTPRTVRRHIRGGDNCPHVCDVPPVPDKTIKIEGEFE